MAEGHCEAPCVKSRSQNWDPTSWKSGPKSFQVSVLETASVKIQAPKLRSQVLKTMSWKSYPKISQVFSPGRPALPLSPCPCRPALPCLSNRQTDIVDEEKLSEKWLLITSLSGCSLEPKSPSFVTDSPDRTRPVTPFFTSAIPGLRSALECPNLISSNSFAHRLGTGNSALISAQPGRPETRAPSRTFCRWIKIQNCRVFSSFYD